MPTKLKNRDGNWLARVVINGKEVDSKIFPKGRKKGPEWTAAKNWEEQRKTEILKNMTKPKTPSDLKLLLDWGEKYLIFAERTMGHSTFIEKKTVMQAFFKETLIKENSFCMKIENYKKFENCELNFINFTFYSEGINLITLMARFLLRCWHEQKSRMSQM